MSKKSIEDKEYNELLGLKKTLADIDFSKNSNKEAIFNKVLKNINECKGDNIVKKSNKLWRAVASFAVVCIMSISLAQTSFAQDLVERIIKSLSLGHITVIQESPELEQTPIPNDLNGEETVSLANGEVITAKEKENGAQKLEIRDPGELNNYTRFNVILPSYLPDGYKFDRAEFYQDEKGVVSKKYIDLYFTNKETGKYIYMQQRFADEETAFETGDTKIEKVKINGVDAVILGDRNIYWESDNVLYSLSGRGQITKSELKKIAESVE